MTNEEAKDRKGIYTSIKEAPEGRKLRMALFFSAFSILMIYLIGFPMAWYWKAGFTGIIMIVLAIFLVSRHSGRRSHELAALAALAYMSLVLLLSVLAFLVSRFAVFASEADLEAYFRSLSQGLLYSHRKLTLRPISGRIRKWGSGPISWST